MQRQQLFQIRLSTFSKKSRTRSSSSRSLRTVQDHRLEESQPRSHFITRLIIRKECKTTSLILKPQSLTSIITINFKLISEASKMRVKTVAWSASQNPRKVLTAKQLKTCSAVVDYKDTGAREILERLRRLLRAIGFCQVYKTRVVFTMCSRKRVQPTKLRTRYSQQRAAGGTFQR